MYHIPRATDSLGSTSTTSTTATAPHHGPQKFSSPSRVIMVAVFFCFGVAILIILGVFLYNRRRRRQKHSVKVPCIVFDKDLFAKKAASSDELDKYMMADLPKMNSSALSAVHPQYYRESSTSSTYTFDDKITQQPRNLFKIANVDEDEIMATPTLAFPKPLAEKKSRRPRSKPTWLSPITTGEEAREEVRSPPLTYGISNPEREILFPTLPQMPPQRAKATLMPTTPRKSHASLKSMASSQSLIIPDFEPMPVISPARSESFARKDLDLPSPPPPHTPPATFTFGLDSAGGQIGSSRVEHDKDVELSPSRLMTVVALYTPNLPDELPVKLGDVVRVIAEYKDGWCFAQFLGGIDAPKGVVPFVCLQTAFTHTHKASNKSLTASNWR